jgi:hypothetical protein
MLFEQNKNILQFKYLNIFVSRKREGFSNSFLSYLFNVAHLAIYIMNRNSTEKKYLVNKNILVNLLLFFWIREFCYPDQNRQIENGRIEYISK